MKPSKDSEAEAILRNDAPKLKALNSGMVCMHSLDKLIFLAAHEAQKPGFHGLYRFLMANQWKSRETLLREQALLLRRMVHFCYNRVPLYRRRFRESGLMPSDIRNQSDLEKISPLTKKDILSNKADFLPTGRTGKYHMSHTGGTTGSPLSFRVSHDDRFFSGALLYRGWSGGGYHLGDRMLVMGGPSLLRNPQMRVRLKINELTRKLRYISYFKLDKADLQKYTMMLQSWKPSFLRGAPSGLNELAEHIENHSADIPRLKAIFTTTEKLYPHVRKNLERVFGARVFDGYGANDGGVGAYEYDCGNLHIDTERSILEVVDEENNQITQGRGRVLATSLRNFAMPFLRYEVEDEVVATEQECHCGRGLPILEEIIGRTVSVFVKPDGGLIHGWFFNIIFLDIGETVKQYRVVQETEERIVIYLIPGPGFGDHTIQQISHFVETNCSDWELDFRIVESIPKSRSGKVIFIESLVKR
ncbi:MAG: phenylacetate--CoA ligase family protein [Candidatus Thorarchaeota archaeon]